MRKILQIIICCLFITALNAQTPVCTPNPLYKDSSAGPYPRPFDTLNFPKGGIDKPACLGKPYSFTFTIKVTDSITIKLFGTTLTLPLDSVVIASSGGIKGMPTGLSYACNPPNCSFPKNSMNCVIITGTPASTNAVKDYLLEITGKAYNFLAPGGQEIKFPGSDFPGEYKLKLLAANDAKCTTSGIESLSGDISSLRHAPNPVKTSLQILIESGISDVFEFSVYDIVGQQVYRTPLSIQAGTNFHELNTDNLPNGMYIYMLKKENKVMSNKFIINR